MKFEENSLRGFREKVVPRCRWTDDRQKMITIAHPHPLARDLTNYFSHFSDIIRRFIQTVSLVKIRKKCLIFCEKYHQISSDD